MLISMSAYENVEDEDDDDDNDAPVVFSRPLLVCVPSDEDS